MLTKLVLERKRVSAVDSVIENIKRWLLSKKLKPGDKLPNELDLSRHLSTSRGSVREAMKVLEALGIMDVRQGDGTYVSKTVKHVPFDPLLFSLILTEAETQEILELRESIEIIVAKLIIKNASDSDLESLKKVYTDLEKKLELGAIKQEEIISDDLAFHFAMASICGNRLIEKLYVFIIDFLRPTIKGHDVLNSHRVILDALCKREVENATSAVLASHKAWKIGLSATAVE